MTTSPRSDEPRAGSHTSTVAETGLGPLRSSKVSHMSTPPSSESTRTGIDSRTDVQSLAGSIRSRVDRETLAAPLRATSFYVAVALPLTYLPMLVSGLETVSQISTFALLLVANLVAFVVGHGHRPGE